MSVKVSSEITGMMQFFKTKPLVPFEFHGNLYITNFVLVIWRTARGIKATVLSMKNKGKKSSLQNIIFTKL